MSAFSVVIPAFNAEATLSATLGSLDRQIERDFEVIIVDDGSSDGTGVLAAGLCEGRPNWRVIHQQNRGLPAARNAAIAVASGRWIALLDADDWFLPGHLKRMRELLGSAPDVGLAFVDGWIWDEERRRFARRGATAQYRPRPLPGDQWGLFRALVTANFVFVAACFPRSLVLELGGFNESLRAAEDWELWLRIVGRGHRIVGVDERLAVYRHRIGQMSKDPKRMWEGQRDALRSVLASCDLPADVEADLRARIERLEATPAGQDSWRHPMRDLVGRGTRWASPIRDYRLRAPRAVTRTLGKLG